MTEIFQHDIGKGRDWLIGDILTPVQTIRNNAVLILGLNFPSNKMMEAEPSDLTMVPLEHSTDKSGIVSTGHSTV
jgi:hypothetical protein